MESTTHGDTTVCVSKFAAALAHPLYGANVLLKIVRTAVCTTNEHVSGPFLLPCCPYPRRQKKYAGCWLCRWASVFIWSVGIDSIRPLSFRTFIPIVKYVKIRVFSLSVLYVKYVQNNYGLDCQWFFWILDIYLVAWCTSVSHIAFGFWHIK